MSLHGHTLQEQRDFELLDRILRGRGQSLHDFLAAGAAGETLPLGDVGRELVGQKRAIAQGEEFGQRYGVGDRVEGANPGGPSFRTKAAGGPHAQGVDALLGALRIAQITGGASDIPSRSPEFGELSQAQLTRARNPAVKALDRRGITSGSPGVLKNAATPTRPQETNHDLERLRQALANSPAGAPGPGQQVAGRAGRIGLGEQREMGDIRAGAPWARVEAVTPRSTNPYDEAGMPVPWYEQEQQWDQGTQWPQWTPWWNRRRR